MNVIIVIIVIIVMNVLNALNALNVQNVLNTILLPLAPCPLPPNYSLTSYLSRSLTLSFSSMSCVMRVMS